MLSKSTRRRLRSSEGPLSLDIRDDEAVEEEVELGEPGGGGPNPGQRVISAGTEGGPKQPTDTTGKQDSRLAILKDKTTRRVQKRTETRETINTDSGGKGAPGKQIKQEKRQRC